MNKPSKLIQKVVTMDPVISESSEKAEENYNFMKQDRPEMRLGARLSTIAAPYTTDSQLPEDVITDLYQRNSAFTPVFISTPKQQIEKSSTLKPSMSPNTLGDRDQADSFISRSIRKKLEVDSTKRRQSNAKGKIFIS